MQDTHGEAFGLPWFRVSLWILKAKIRFVMCFCFCRACSKRHIACVAVHAMGRVVVVTSHIGPAVARLRDDGHDVGPVWQKRRRVEPVREPKPVPISVLVFEFE